MIVRLDSVESTNRYCEFLDLGETEMTIKQEQLTE